MASHGTFEPSDQKFKMFQDGKHLCSLGHSPHQIIYNLYNVIALTEIKGYAMLQFSYMMLKIYGKVPYQPIASSPSNVF